MKRKTLSLLKKIRKIQEPLNLRQVGMNKFIDEDDYEAKIEMIMEWAEENQWFEISFVEKMYERLQLGKHLTDNMCAAIDNILNRTVLRDD